MGSARAAGLWVFQRVPYQYCSIRLGRAFSRGNEGSARPSNLNAVRLTLCWGRLGYWIVTVGKPVQYGGLWPLDSLVWLCCGSRAVAVARSKAGAINTVF